MLCMNRRVRTRTHGGVGAWGGQPPPATLLLEETKDYRLVESPRVEKPAGSIKDDVDIASGRRPFRLANARRSLAAAFQLRGKGETRGELDDHGKNVDPVSRVIAKSRSVPWFKGLTRSKAPKSMEKKSDSPEPGTVCWAPTPGFAVLAPGGAEEVTRFAVMKPAR